MLIFRKAICVGATTRVPPQPGVVLEPGMCARSLYGNREISHLSVGVQAVRIGKAEEAVADDERVGEVGPLDSSDEVGEQSWETGGGVDGAKRGGQGNHEPAKHAPNSVSR